MQPLSFSLFYNSRRSISPAAQAVLDLISDKFNSLLDDTNKIETFSKNIG
jgi:hypothetical protein